MPLDLVTHTQTLIDSLWEIDTATEQASWIQTSQTHRYNNSNNNHIRARRGTQYQIEYVVARLNLNPELKRTQPNARAVRSKRYV